MTKEERIAQIKLQKDEYYQIYNTLKNRNEYYTWLERELISTSNSLERRHSTTLFAKRMGATDEDIARVYALEDRNHYDAFRLMTELVAMHMPFSEEAILALHGQVLKDLNDAQNIGRYRREHVRILHSTTTVASVNNIPVLMKELIASVNNSTKEVVLESFDMHHQFVSIHPFIDGNGRTGRLLMNFNLLRNAYFPIVIHPKRRIEYIESLEIADQDREKYHSFMLDEMDTTFRFCMDKMISLPRTSTMTSMAIVARHQNRKKSETEKQYE